MAKRAISGIQSTGNLHLGNYLGAIRHWVDMQDDYECFYFLADLHAITISQDPQDLHNSILSTTAALIASGIDTTKTTLFAQSDVKEHSELAWILSCNTPLGWLKRMTQFKDKAGKNQDNASTGLLTYPVLMAADILLYNADVVPVGEDQKQHLELTRDIAGSINSRFSQNILKIPEPLIQGKTTRVKSLRDGTKKMSKSNPSDASRINLSDSKDDIISKIKKAKTDSFEHVSYEEARPEISNLLEIFSELSGISIDKIVLEYENSGFAKFKSDLADCLAEKISPINTEYNKLLTDKSYLIDQLKIGSERAREEAVETLLQLKEKFGFVNSRY